MVGFSEDSEQQKFNSLEAPSDKKKSGLEATSPSSGPLATLRQDISMLVNNNLTETEQGQQIAVRENVYDEQGNIIDVRFQQNNKSKSLKNILPGTYTIAFTEVGNSYAYKKENKIEVSSLHTEGPINLTLLHEAGHMVDYRRSEQEYQLLEQEQLSAKLKEHLFYAKMADARDGENLFPGAITFAHKVIEEQKTDFSPKAIEELKQVVDETSKQLPREHAVEEFDRLKDEQRTLWLTLSTRLKVQRERNAWANALHALRELKQQGITVFSGTKQDLLQEINHALVTYEFTEGEQLSPTDRHFIRS